MRNSNGPLILTPGEPGGVGFEIVAKAWQILHNQPEMCFALIGDFEEIRRRFGASTVAIPCKPIENLNQAATIFASALPVLHRPMPHAVTIGQFSTANAPWVIAAIDEAVDLCLAGSASAMVTCPMQKEALYAAGFRYQGHTDYLAALSKKRGHNANDVMMLVGGGLRAVPVTVHIALKDVPAALTREAIVTQTEVVHQALIKQFNIANPRIAMTGLNPHAGENGAMGREEIEVIRPAIAELAEIGITIRGPLPADTAFFLAERENYDAIICMYHDQALIPVKTLDFHGGVNVTLGLPFIRTSPDHGTALALAGTGKAQADSLIAAIVLAQKMSHASR